jgi:S1/P1 Nuclease
MSFWLGLESLTQPMAIAIISQKFMIIRCADDKEENSMRYLRQIVLLLIVPFMAFPAPASAWNVHGHMLSGAIAFQVLEQQNPDTINKVKAILQNHPFHSIDEWQPQLAELPASEQDLMLFMLAARWPDDIRQNPQFHKSTFHFINLPFKPAGQPASVQIKEPGPVNILTALAENESVVKNENDGERKAIALAGSFTLLATYTSRFIPRSCSRLITRRETVEVTRYAYEKKKRTIRSTFTNSGTL